MKITTTELNALRALMKIRAFKGCARLAGWVTNPLVDHLNNWVEANVLTRTFNVKGNEVYKT